MLGKEVLGTDRGVSGRPLDSKKPLRSSRVQSIMWAQLRAQLTVRQSCEGECDQP